MLCYIFVIRVPRVRTASKKAQDPPQLQEWLEGWRREGRRKGWIDGWMDG
jgi:hypothetical protein